MTRPAAAPKLFGQSLIVPGIESLEVTKATMKLPAWLWGPGPSSAPDLRLDDSVVFPGLPDHRLSPGIASLLLENGHLGWRTLSVVILELCIRERLRLRDRRWTGRNGYDLQVITTESTDALTYDPDMSAEGANLLDLLGSLVRESGYLPYAAPGTGQPTFPSIPDLVQAIAGPGSLAFQTMTEPVGLMSRTDDYISHIANQTEIGAWAKGELLGLKNLLTAAYAGTTMLSDGEIPSGPLGLTAHDRLLIWSVVLGMEQALYHELCRSAGGLYADWQPAWCQNVAAVHGLDARGSVVEAAIMSAQELLHGDFISWLLKVDNPDRLALP